MPEQILIIDDEAGLRLTFTYILQDEGYALTAVGSGPEALQALAQSEYDLAYLDIRLPGMDGLQVLKEIHRLYPALPVILITAHASVQSAVEAMRLGATDYLLKPVNPAALVARTRAVLAEQAVQRRRQEIAGQMQALQTEWLALNTSPEIPVAETRPAPAALAPATLALETNTSERYLRRGTLMLDCHLRRITVRGRTTTLPPATFDYLVALARHAPRPLGYQALVSEAQGYKSDLREAQELTRWHVHKLREALEPDPKQPQHILTVRGVGYRLVVD